MLVFSVLLGATYWSKGFFNVSVDFQRHLTMTDGRVDIYLGSAVEPIIGRISRSANTNATPRIFGNKALADFFQDTFKQGDFVSIEILSPTALRIGGQVPRDKDMTSSVAPVQHHLTVATPVAASSHLASSSRRTKPDDGVLIHDLFGHLLRFCEQLWRREQQSATPGDFASLISGLQRQKLVPVVEAGMMHTIRTVRNAHVHEHRRVGPQESRAISAAWQVIVQWAEREHADLWKSTADLPKPR